MKDYSYTNTFYGNKSLSYLSMYSEVCVCILNDIAISAVLSQQCLIYVYFDVMKSINLFSCDMSIK